MSEPTKPLLIDTNSWHYQYFCYVRSLYGVDTPVGQRTSLCPYFQTMLWGSVLFALTLPLQILGWVALKSVRWCYRMAEYNQLQKFTDWIDQTPVGPTIEQSGDYLETHPWLTTVLWGLACVIMGTTLGLLIFALSMGVWQFLLLIPKIPAAIYWLFMYIGWAIIWIFASIAYAVLFVAKTIGFVAISAFNGLVWLVQATWLWQAIWHYFLMALAIVVGSVVVSLVCAKLWRSEFAQSLKDFIAMKFNGYKEARADAVARREKETPADQIDQPCVFCENVKAFFSSIRLRCENAIEGCVDFFVSRDVTIDGITKTVMSPFAVMATSIWAWKTRLCPLIEFVDVSASVQAPPAQEVAKESVKVTETPSVSKEVEQ